MVGRASLCTQTFQFRRLCYHCLLGHLRPSCCVWTCNCSMMWSYRVSLSKMCSTGCLLAHTHACKRTGRANRYRNTRCCPCTRCLGHSSHTCSMLQPGDENGWMQHLNDLSHLQCPPLPGALPVHEDCAPCDVSHCDCAAERQGDAKLTRSPLAEHAPCAHACGLPRRRVCHWT